MQGCMELAEKKSRRIQLIWAPALLKPDLKEHGNTKDRDRGGIHNRAKNIW